jgi:putative nucleotidyltransferase with HDIG domain
VIVANFCGSIHRDHTDCGEGTTDLAISGNSDRGGHGILQAVAAVQISTGSEVHLVGGAVRDRLLGREAQDLDFVVSGSGIAFAREVSKLIGGRFVLLDSEHDETRVVPPKGPVLDFSGRGDRPLEEDLARRDFTINAMALAVTSGGDLDQSAVDPYHGRDDLRKGIIRIVTSNSLDGDPLRVLRAYRLAAQFGFTIEGRTRRQMRQVAGSIGSVAQERVREELLKLLTEERAFPHIEAMSEDGVLAQILPVTEGMDHGARGHFKGDGLMTHSLRCLWRVEELIADPAGSVFSKHWPIIEDYLQSHPHKKALLKLGALLHDVAKPSTEIHDEKGRLHFYGHDRIGASMVEQMLKDRLRFSTKDTVTVVTLVLNHMWPHLLAREPELTERAIRRFFRTCGEESIGLLLLALADAQSSGGGHGVAHLESALDCMLSYWYDERSREPSKPLITGNDLIHELGLTPGPLFRTILQHVEEQQAEGAIATREEALDVARKVVAEKMRSEQ